MRTNVVGICALIAMAIAPARADADELGDAPGVMIAAPLDGAMVGAGATVLVDARGRAGVAMVELWIDGVQIGIDPQAPYRFVAPTTLVDGEHVIETRAVAGDGRSSVAAVLVTVATQRADADVVLATGCRIGGVGCFVLAGVRAVVLVAERLAPERAVRLSVSPRLATARRIFAE
jgi:hypothetical protein